MIIPISGVQDEPWFLFLFCFVWDKSYYGSPGWPGVLFVDQAAL